MGPLVPVSRFWGWLRGWLWALADALPPYQKAEGPLESKEAGLHGRFHIHVGRARVEVDRATFDTLAVGERLRVRYTRGDRGVNIDRLATEQDL